MSAKQYMEEKNMEKFLRNETNGKFEMEKEYLRKHSQSRLLEAKKNIEQKVGRFQGYSRLASRKKDAHINIIIYKGLYELYYEFLEYKGEVITEKVSEYDDHDDKPSLIFVEKEEISARIEPCLLGNHVIFFNGRKTGMEIVSENKNQEEAEYTKCNSYDNNPTGKGGDNYDDNQNYDFWPGDFE